MTCFFKIYSNGSTGAGINIQNAIKTTAIVKKAKKNSFKILINNKKTKAETSKIVLEEMLSKTKEKYEILIKHQTKLPIGYGLGLSGAGALSLTKALNESLNLGLLKKEIVSIANNADIKAGTGLGDVIAEQYSGTMIGLPPYPSKKISKIKNTYKYVALGFFGKMETKKIIQNKKHKEKINKIGSYCMNSLHKNKTIKNLIHLSRVFSIESELATKQVRIVMDAIPNSSMAMLGNTVFVLTNKPKETEKQLKQFTKKTMVSIIS